MRASIVVVSYNSAGYLPHCLGSIAAELGSADELIVVDNGSSDGSADLVAERYPWARLLRGENTGYAGGNNAGAAVARGEFLVLLNPDTALAPCALEALLAPFAAHAAVGLTTARIVHMQRPDVVNACGNTVHLTGLTYCRGAGRPAAEFAAQCEVDAVSGAAFAIRRALFEQLGGFDEQFFMYVEDTDLSLRARLAGYSVQYVPGAVVQHDYRMSYSPTKAFYLERNRHLMLLKNLSGATYTRLVPALLLGELITWAFLLLKGPRFWGVKPRAYRWLWTHRADIVTRRSIHTAHESSVVARLTDRLEFGQVTNGLVAATAALLCHPAFRAARWMFSVN